MKRAFLSLCLILALAGCATQDITALPQLSRDESVKTFQQLGYGEWIQNPFVRKEAICGAEKVNIPLSDLRLAAFSLRQSRLTLAVTTWGVCGGNYIFHLKDLEDARRLVAAANSLGAKVDNFFAAD
ncbi:hypothetical protein [Massilia sp. Leaf139]|uniref:hypothetical protein n=1 Tax=Massilia sp. Leaf139 TaxID=1736272 RepID=UPI0012E89E26|nr:hypothetical protein [Massilia sp. Leaf139]